MDRIAEELQVTGVAVSAAVMAMRQAAGTAGRAEQWGKVVDMVRASCADLGLQRVDDLTPVFLAAAHRDLVGNDPFTAERCESTPASWRTQVGQFHPEDERLHPDGPSVRPICH